MLKESVIVQWAGLVLIALVLVAGTSSAWAQDIEPRAYSNAPVGVNFLIAGYAYTRGGVAFGPSLPLTNPNLNTSSAIVAYARVLDLWGMSAKFLRTPVVQCPQQASRFHFQLRQPTSRRRAARLVY
jgi:hypothetical protein